jgi:hypothetical protein
VAVEVPTKGDAAGWARHNLEQLRQFRRFDLRAKLAAVGGWLMWSGILPRCGLLENSLSQATLSLVNDRKNLRHYQCVLP